MTSAISRVTTRGTILATALAVALSPLAAAPARAGDDRDIVRFLNGLATIYSLQRGLDGRSDRVYRHDYPRYGHRSRIHDDWLRGRYGPGYGYTRHGPRYDKYDRHGPRYGRHHPRRDHARHGRRHRDIILPQRCHHGLKVRGSGTTYVYGGRCLARHGLSAYELPQRCFVQIRTKHGLRPGYRAHCLHRSGFRLGY